VEQFAIEIPAVEEVAQTVFESALRGFRKQPSNLLDCQISITADRLDQLDITIRDLKDRRIFRPIFFGSLI
jgi:hypothetical protein